MTNSKFHLLSTGLALALLAGCGRTTGTDVPELDPTTRLSAAMHSVSLVMTRLTEIKPGANPTTFAGNRVVLAVASGQAQTDDVKLAVSGTGAALADRPLLPSPGDPSEEDPEGALREWETQFADVQPKANYRVQATTPIAVGDRRTYWVIQKKVGKSVTDKQITARAVHVGPHCYVMVDEQVGDTLDERAREVGAAFDNSIYTTNTRLFGVPKPEAARTGDTKVTILISPVVGNYEREGTLGYFSLRDMFAPEDAPDIPALQQSNSRFMLYMAARIVRKGSKEEYLGTIAHEYQHLISASYKVFGGAKRQEALWLNEGLSMYAMQANGFGLTNGTKVVVNHVNNFLNRPSAYSLTQFQLGPKGSSYGAAYLFATYLAERFGEGFLTELVASKERDVANLEARLATRGTTFEQVFRDWVATLLLDGSKVSQDPKYEFRTLDLHGTYGGKKLSGVSLQAVSMPLSGTMKMLPYSAGFFLLEGEGSGSYAMQLPHRTGLGGWLVTP